MTSFGLRHIVMGISFTLTVGALPVLAHAGNLVSARVENQSGAGLPGIVFIFENRDTGEEVPLAEDATDAAGNFSTTVPIGPYAISIVDNDQAYGPIVFAFDITGPASIGTRTLTPARTVAGHVEDESSSPIFNVDIDVIDEASDLKVFTTNDNTDLFGDYAVVVSSGVFEFQFTPATGSPFAAERVLGVSIGGSTTLSDVVLKIARSVTGTIVNDTGGAFSSVDVNVFDAATGIKRHTPDDDTDVTGAFNVGVPDGLYDFTFSPPAGAGYAAGVRRDVSISGATSLGTIALERGVRVSGQVTGGGPPVADVDLDFVDSSTSDVYPTPDDNTDGSGVYAVRVPAGSYVVVATPPTGSGYSPKTIAAASYTSDSVLNIDLGVAVSTPDVAAIEQVSLRVHPNPFSVGVVMSFDDAVSEGTRVTIFDAAGRHVRSLAVAASGSGVLTWDGRSESGHAAAPGHYFVRVTDAAGVVARSQVVKLK